MQKDSPAVPLRRRLFGLAAAAILPVALVAAPALQALFDEQRAQGERAALEVSRALGTAVDAKPRRALGTGDREGPVAALAPDA